MNSLLNPDNPIMKFITKIAYAFYLNVLWFICSIPIFTIGASTTALFYVSLKMAKDEEGNITRSFFRSFKENFKQATVIWLILLGLGIILGIDGYVFYHMRFENALWTIGAAIFIVALVAYAIVLIYIFPLLSRFNNTTKEMFKNALMIGMRFLLCTVLMMVIYAVMALIVVYVFTPAIVFAEGLCAFLCSLLLSNILIMCEEKPESETLDESHEED